MESVGFLGAAVVAMPPVSLNDGDKALVRLFMAACFHRWEDLPGPHRSVVSAAGRHRHNIN